MQQNLLFLVNSFVQRAGIAALKEPEHDVERMRGIYDCPATITPPH